MLRNGNFYVYSPQMIRIKNNLSRKCFVKCKQIVESYRGSLRIASKPSEVSTYNAFLPIDYKYNSVYNSYKLVNFVEICRWV